MQGQRIQNILKKTGGDEATNRRDEKHLTTRKNMGTYDRVLVKVGPVWNQGVMTVHGAIEKLFF